MADVGAEGKEGKEGQLDALQTERNADHGQAKRKAAQQIFEEQNDTTPQQNPQDVPEKFHVCSFLIPQADGLPV